MRGKPHYQSQIYIRDRHRESWIPEDDALRGVKARANAALGRMREDLERAYSKLGRPSIPPETLLKALLLQALYSIRSERQLVEQIQMNLLYRWFIDLSLDGKVWNATSFTKNRERFEKHGLLPKFFDRVVEQALVEEWASSEDFAVDGSLIESYASMKSVRPKESEDTRVSDGAGDDDPGNPTVNFRGERRTNETHHSLTDPEARLARKSNGQESRLAHGLHVLIENRNGLVLEFSPSEANGTAEREQALVMVRRTKERHGLAPRTLAADKGYAGPFWHTLDVEEEVVPLVPIRRGAIRSTTPAGEPRRRARQRTRTRRYKTAQRTRERVEEIYGWGKTIGGLRRSRHVGRWKIEQQGLVVCAAYNLLRLTRRSRERCA